MGVANKEIREKKSPTKQSKSFFDYPDKEKKRIIKEAAKEASKMQQELIDRATKQSEECKWETCKAQGYHDEYLHTPSKPVEEDWEDKMRFFLRRILGIDGRTGGYKRKKKYLDEIISQAKLEAKRELGEEIKKIENPHVYPDKIPLTPEYAIFEGLREDILKLIESST